MTPGSPQNKAFDDAWQQCREAMRRARFDEVIQTCEKLLAVDPANLEIGLMQADALAGAEDHARAAQAYERVLQRAPEHPIALVRRARSLSRIGRHAEAHAAYARAFSLNRGALTALHGLLHYENMVPDDPALQQLRSGVNDGRIRPDHRALGAFLLGRILFNAGRDDEAYGVYALANRLVCESRPDAGQVPALTGLTHWFEETQRLKLGQPMAASAPCPALIISGLPRSGKSLIESLIARHPAVQAGGELGLLAGIVNRCSGDPPEVLNTLRQASPAPLAASYARALLKVPKPDGCRFITDTSPENLWCLGYMGWLHPEVPVILCRRRPLDNGVAIFFSQYEKGYLYSYAQTSLGKTMAAAEHAIEMWRKVLPNPVLVLDYEETVSSPDDVRAKILAFLGLDATHVEPVKTTSPSRTILHPSHSVEDFDVIRSDGVGFGERFHAHFEEMLSVYARARHTPDAHLSVK